jgi:hypothetical protein
MAHYPLTVKTSEFREWLSKFSKLVEKKQYHKLAYDKWRPMYLWSKDDEEWEEIEINVFHDPDIFYILPRHSEKLSPNGVEVIINEDKSFGQYLMDAADNFQMQNTLCLSASTMSDAISSVSTAIKSLSDSLTTQIYRPYSLDDLKISTDIDTDTSRCYELNVDGLTIKENGESMTLEDYFNKIIEKNSNNNKENEKSMFKFDFGPVASHVHMSLYGMAIKNPTGTYVAYDTKTGNIMDVDILNFEGADKFMYKVPVALNAVASGDVVVHQGKPMFVQAVFADGRLKVLDVYNAEEKTIVPPRSPFGFDYITKIISLFDFSNADTNNPFGNMLPFLMLSDSRGADKDNLLPLMLMANGGKMDTSNPMLMWALMGNRTNDPMMLALMMGSFNPPTHTCACGGNCTSK